MATVYQNTYGVDFMIWEVNPKLRKKNNIVKLLTEENLQPGDMVVGSDYGGEKASLWTVKRIADERPSVVGPDKKYLTVEMEWKFVSFSFFDTVNRENLSNMFLKAYEKKRVAAKA